MKAFFAKKRLLQLWSAHVRTASDALQEGARGCMQSTCQRIGVCFTAIKRSTPKINTALTTSQLQTLVMTSPTMPSTSRPGRLQRHLVANDETEAQRDAQS